MLTIAGMLTEYELLTFSMSAGRFVASVRFSRPLPSCCESPLLNCPDRKGSSAAAASATASPPAKPSK